MNIEKNRLSELKESPNYTFNKNYFLSICSKIRDIFNDEDIELDDNKTISNFERSYIDLKKEIEIFEENEKEDENKEDEKTILFLKIAFKEIIQDFEKVRIENYNFSKKIYSLLNALELSKETFFETYLQAKEEKYLEFHSQSNSKILIGMVKSELPLMLQRIFDISTGSFIKNDGTKMTLKEYSQITNQDIGHLNILLNSAKKLIEKKISEYGLENTNRNTKGI